MVDSDLYDQKIVEKIIEQARQRIAQGEPLGLICNWLLSGYKNSNMSLEAYVAYGELSKNLGKDLGKAQLFERKDQINDAIAIYENALMDWFDGSFPYERLRVLYLKQKRYDDAIRVCESFVKMIDKKTELGYYNGNNLVKRNKFAEWVTKIKNMTGKQ